MKISVTLAKNLILKVTITLLIIHLFFNVLKNKNKNYNKIYINDTNKNNDTYDNIYIL